eukprot:6653570-Lingulodinium_polyedra.AAC.1
MTADAYNVRWMLSCIAAGTAQMSSSSLVRRWVAAVGISAQSGRAWVSANVTPANARATSTLAV